MKKIRNLKEIKVRPTDDPTDQLIVHMDNSHYHVAHVNGYVICTKKSFSHYTNVSPGYTLEDLKQLLKELRKVIRHESNKQL